MGLKDSETVISANIITDGDDVFLITSGGTLVRISAKEISTIGRSTKGVRLIRLKKKETLVAAQVFEHDMSADE